MQRLYFLTPNSGSTIKITDELHSIGISRDAIHVVCRDSKLLDGLELHKATVRQTSDVMHAAKRGALLGLVLGIWASTLIGVSIPDVKVDKFESEIRDGSLL